MAPVNQEYRASELAERSVELINSGKVEEAARALKEALFLSPDNVKVKRAFLAVQEHESVQPLLKLCQSFATGKDSRSGEEALWYLSDGNAASLPTEVSGRCFDLVLGASAAKNAALRDDLIAGLLHHCSGARTHLARKLKVAISPVFQEIFSIGDGAANGITVVSLDSQAWPSEEARLNAAKDVFLLFLAKFLETGSDYDGRALKGIARHLAVDGEYLHQHIDASSFEAILYCLDYRLPHDVRSQATLATAKYLEASKEEGEKYLTEFIVSRTAKHSTEDLVKAFSAAAAVFPIVTPVVSKLFLTEGFLASLVPMLDKKSRPIKVEKAALDMLSAACIDAGCREAISRYCLEWMHHVMDDEADERHGQAAVILAKVQGVTIGDSNGNQARDAGANDHTSDETSRRRSSKNIADVVPILKGMLVKGDEINTRTAIEGLAYASMQPSAKDEIIRDIALLKHLLELPGKDSMSPTAAFGALTLLENLTRFLPTMSEEQKRMDELKAYAAASKPAQPSPLDADAAVSARCKRLLDSRVVPYLIALKSSFVATRLSPASLALMCKIFLSLSRPPSTRGLLAQQGSMILLLNLYSTIDPASKPTAAHAIARMLISVDPALLSSHTTACLTPLLSLLTPTDQDTVTSTSERDLLPTFESLLALTNLASDPTAGPATASVLTRTALPKLDNLLLSEHVLLQRAATELVCNLCASSGGGLPFIPSAESGADVGTARRRLHVLLALADARDVGTRRAAGGAVAGLTECEAGVRGVLERERGVEMLCRMCQDVDAGVVHRGVVCVRNMVGAEGSAGVDGRRMLREVGVKKALEDVEGRGGVVGELVREVLRILDLDAEVEGKGKGMMDSGVGKVNGVALGKVN